MRRSKHSLTNYKLLTMEMGIMTPINCTPINPGDTIQQVTRCLVRMNPLVAPVMHPIRIRIHHWFVPNRLIWDKWEDFITGGEDGRNSSEHPIIKMDNVVKCTLPDYIGIPVGDYTTNGGLTYNALPFRAFNLIFNEHYRDQQLQQERFINKSDGLDDTTDLSLARCCWEKDYFSTIRPEPSLGPDILLPVGLTAPIAPASVGAEPTFDHVGQTNRRLFTEADGRSIISETAGSGSDGLKWNNPNLIADLSQATGISVNDLRLFLSRQRLQEARMQYGTRYSEFLKWLVPGLNPSDARLQEPEYLGGGRQILNISEIIQTAEGSDPVGTLKGHGITGIRTNRYRRFFEEHGWIMTIASIVPKAIYSQGLPRHFSPQTKEDYFQKEFAYTGEMLVPNKEVYANQDDTQKEEKFGYQKVYDHMRYQQSDIAGDFNDILNYWHLARDFAAPPALNASFVECSPSKRIFADQANQGMQVMANNSIQVRSIVPRNPMPRTF